MGGNPEFFLFLSDQSQLVCKLILDIVLHKYLLQYSQEL